MEKNSFSLLWEEACLFSLSPLSSSSLPEGARAAASDALWLQGKEFKTKNASFQMLLSNGTHFFQTKS